MNTKKSLTKVFGPVLLLTATLALPMDTAFAAKDGRAAAHAQADKHDNKKDKAQQRQQGRRADQRKQQQKRVEVRQPNRGPKAAQQHRVERQKEQKRAEVRRQQVIQQNRIEHQQALQRQQALQTRALERQRVLDRQRAIDRQRLLQRQRQNQAYRYDDRYRAAPRRGGGGGGANPNVFHVDGWLDAGGDCLFLNDHEGRTWAMVGNTYGLEPGEHVRLYGQPVYGGACGHGAAFDIYEVRTVWADNNHRRTYYDHLYDGSFDQNRAYDDDRYYNGAYDPYEDRDDRDSWWERIFGG